MEEFKYKYVVNHSENGIIISLMLKENNFVGKNYSFETISSAMGWLEDMLQKDKKNDN